MTKAEYDIAKKHLQDEYEKKDKELGSKYAIANSPVKIGDKITDHIGMIKVEKILVTRNTLGRYPECVYIGENYTRSGTISKRDPRRSVYQCNLINQ